jgi:hypothetical protein
MTIRDEKREHAERSASYSSQGPPPPRGAFSDDVPDVVVSDGFSDSNLALPEVAELGAEEDVPPAYSEQYDQLKLHQAGFDAGAAVTSEHTKLQHQALVFVYMLIVITPGHRRRSSRHQHQPDLTRYRRHHCAYPAKAD